MRSIRVSAGLALRRAPYAAGPDPAILLTDGIPPASVRWWCFLPQIVILFFFILADGSFGLHGPRRLPDGPPDGTGRPSGRSFIPLLSSFACAIPGIMATRAYADAKDRLTTILIAPMMTFRPACRSMR